MIKLGMIVKKFGMNFNNFYIDFFLSIFDNVSILGMILIRLFVEWLSISRNTSYLTL